MNSQNVNERWLLPTSVFSEHFEHSVYELTPEAWKLLRPEMQAHRYVVEVPSRSEEPATLDARTLASLGRFSGDLPGRCIAGWYLLTHQEFAILRVICQLDCAMPSCEGESFTNRVRTALEKAATGVDAIIQDLRRLYEIVRLNTVVIES